MFVHKCLCILRERNIGEESFKEVTPSCNIKNSEPNRVLWLTLCGDVDGMGDGGGSPKREGTHVYI